MSANTVSSGSITIIATSRGTTSMRTGERPERLQRFDLLGDDHRTEFGRDRGAGAARHDDGREHRPEFARDRERYRAADQVADAVVHGLIAPTRTRRPCPVNSEVNRTIAHDCTPSKYACSMVSRTRMRSRADEPDSASGEQHRRAARIREESGRLAAEVLEDAHGLASSASEARTPCTASIRFAATPRSAARLYWRW